MRSPESKDNLPGPFLSLSPFFFFFAQAKTAGGGDNGVLKLDGKAAKALSRLTVCVEALFESGLQDAIYWIMPVRKK